MGFAKNRLTHIQNPPGLASGEPHGGDGKKTTKSEPQPTPGAALQFATSILFLFSFPRPRSFFFSFLPSPRIPTDRRAGRAPPLRVPVPAVASREAHFVWDSLKIDSRAHKTTPGKPSAPGAYPAPHPPAYPAPRTGILVAALPAASSAPVAGLHRGPTLHRAPRRDCRPSKRASMMAIKVAKEYPSRCITKSPNLRHLKK